MGRLPTLFHPSLCSRTEELDPRRWAWAVHPGSRGPHAACRLLQSKRIASTTARPSKPRTPHRSRPLHSVFCGWLEPVSGTSQPRFHGPGVEVVTHSRPLSVAIARDEELYPNPIGSSTSCRKPASAGGWSSLHRRCALTRGTSTGSPSLTPLSRDLALKGRFTHSPAKESALRRTRGAFHQTAHPRKGAPSLTSAFGTTCSLM